MVLRESVMRCEEARQLFDAYLDGELSATLATELGAHRLRCSRCRRALAVLEVSGHIISSDREPVALGGDFGDRLLACMKPSSLRWAHRLRRALYIAGPVAAAAVIVLAFLGFFDRRHPHVAGEKSVQIKRMDVEETRPLAGRSVEGRPLEAGDRAASVEERWLQEWVTRTQKNIAAKRESGKSLQKVLDLTILQLLDILNEANDAARDLPPAHSSGRGPAVPARNANERGRATQPGSSGGNDVEDL